MWVRFWKAKRTLEEKVLAKHLYSLRQACKEYGRQDLYEPLSRVLNPNINWLDRDLELFLKMRRYVIAANVMLYESKTEPAREYLEDAIRSTQTGSVKHRDLTRVMANLEDVAEIARRSWEIEGKYAPIQESEVGWSAKPPTR
jgi:hypothetical protein